MVDWDAAKYGDGTTPFSTKVTYSCPIARKLRHRYPNGTVYFYDSFTIECTWNQTWHPDVYIDPCIWNSCIDPPVPTGPKLMHKWNGVPVPIGDKVEYVCEEPGAWFENREFENTIELECRENGEFELPESWPYCLQGTCK